MLWKQCTGRCKRIKSVNEFYRDESKKNNLRGGCKECISEYNKEYLSNPEAKAAKTERESTPEHKAKARKWANAPKAKLATYKRYLQRKYNITFEFYIQIIVRQNGACAICFKPEIAKLNGETIRLAVDHDHSCCSEKGKSCGKCVRGLLCKSCNMKLGILEKEKLINAIRNNLDSNTPWIISMLKYLDLFRQ